MQSFPLPAGLQAPPPLVSPPLQGFHNVLWRRLGIRTVAFGTIFAGTWYLVERLPFFVQQREALAAAFAPSPAAALSSPPALAPAESAVAAAAAAAAVPAAPVAAVQAVAQVK